MKKNRIKGYDVMLGKYENEMWKHDQNNMAPRQRRLAMFAGFKETTFNILKKKYQQKQPLKIWNILRHLGKEWRKIWEKSNAGH